MAVSRVIKVSWLSVPFSGSSYRVGFSDSCLRSLLSTRPEPGSVRAVPRPHRTARSSKPEALAQKDFQGGSLASPPEDNWLKLMPSRVSQHLSSKLAACSMPVESGF